MGTVFEATDGESRTHIAIKAISGISPEGLLRFKREFRALSEVQHRNVVTLHELAIDGNCMFFTMEYVRGLDFIHSLCGPALPDVRHKHRPVRRYETLRDALTQLASGVHEIHCAGFLHRDIKPPNVLIDNNGRVVLLDFGLVRDLRLDEAIGMTADGAVLGTPLYMSPEQASGERVGKASDWYSVGEMLYQALTGSPPYAGLGMLALLAAKKDDTVKAPSTLNSSIPSDLDELCVDLLRRDPQQRPTGEQVLARLGAGHVPPQAEDSSETLFLGRDSEIAQLEMALQTTCDGRPVVVLLEGVSGIGKTALMHRFFREVVARDSSALVLSGKCSARESIPYKALDLVMDSMSAFLHSLPTAAEARTVLPRDVHAVARLFPVLLGVPAIALTPAHEDGRSPAEARRRGVDALRDLLGRVADRRRVIVHIDDLQWSDVDSLVVLDAVLRHPYAPPLLLVGSFRDGAPQSSAALARFITGLHSSDPAIDVRTLRIGPMGTSEATDLAMRLLGGEAQHRELALEVARESEGSPFFVAELVRHAQQVQRGNTLETDSSVSLDDVIRHRLAALPEEARRLLHVVAVGGGSLPKSVALRVAHPEGADRAALDRLRTEHLLRMSGTSENDSVEIYHDRIREAALRSIPSEQIPPLHMAIARELATSGRADEVALGHHFRRAGEAKVACMHTIAAADQAAAALAFDRAAELYRAALELGSIPAQEIADIEARLGEVLANAGHLYESAKALLRAAARGTDDDRRLEWVRAAANNLLTSGHSKEGRLVLEEALQAVGLALPSSMAGAIASFLKERALLSMRGFRYKICAQAQVPRAQLDRLDTCWAASRGLTYTDGLVGVVFHARHLRLALRCGEPVRLARAFGAEAHLLSSLKPVRKFARAQELLDEAEELVEQADSNLGRGMLHSHRGHVSLMVGNWPDAVSNLDRAAKVLREHTQGTFDEIGYCQAHSALCLQFMGRIRELAPLAHQMLRESTERSNPYVQGFARGIIAHYVLLSANRVDEATEQLAVYREDAPKRFQAHQLNYVSLTVSNRRYCGDFAAAREIFATHEAEMAKFDLLRAPQARGEFLLLKAQCALTVVSDEGATSARLRAVEELGTQLLQLRLDHCRGYGHLVLATVKHQRDDKASAIAHLRKALAAFGRYQMQTMETAVKARLADLVLGSQGQRLRDDVDAYMQREGIVVPDRFVEMIAPGFNSP